MPMQNQPGLPTTTSLTATPYNTTTPRTCVTKTDTQILQDVMQHFPQVVSFIQQEQKCTTTVQPGTDCERDLTPGGTGCGSGTRNRDGCRDNKFCTVLNAFSCHCIN